MGRVHDVTGSRCEQYAVGRTLVEDFGFTNVESKAISLEGFSERVIDDFSE